MPIFGTPFLRKLVDGEGNLDGDGALEGLAICTIQGNRDYSSTAADSSDSAVINSHNIAVGGGPAQVQTGSRSTIYISSGGQRSTVTDTQCGTVGGYGQVDGLRFNQLAEVPLAVGCTGIQADHIVLGTTHLIQISGKTGRGDGKGV